MCLRIAVRRVATMPANRSRLVSSCGSKTAALVRCRSCGRRHAALRAPVGSVPIGCRASSLPARAPSESTRIRAVPCEAADPANNHLPGRPPVQPCSRPRSVCARHPGPPTHRQVSRNPSRPARRRRRAHAGRRALPGSRPALAGTVRFVESGNQNMQGRITWSSCLSESGAARRPRAGASPLSVTSVALASPKINGILFFKIPLE